MPDDTVTLVSTTDSAEEVQAALAGKPAEKPADKPADATAAAKVEDKPAETPAADAKVAEPATEPATPAADAVVTETAEQKAEREEAARVSAREKRKSKIQKEIDDLTTAKYNARRDADAEQARLAQLKQERERLEADQAKPKPETKPTPVAVSLDGAPKVDDADAHGVPKYKNYEEFLDARDKWAIEQSRQVAESVAKKAAEETETKLTKAERERIDRDAADRADRDALAKHEAKLEEFRKTHADYDAVLTDAADVVAEIKEEFGDSAFNVIDQYTTVDADNGPAIVLYLAQHPDEMRTIAAKPVPLQIAALAKIDARLEAASKTGPAPVAAPVTKAPEPIKPVGSTGTASSVSPEDEDYQSYKTRRNREEREKAGVR